MTKAEQVHMSAVQALGCICCRQEGVYSPAELHHPLSGGRRMGHMHVIPLCATHHRAGIEGVSRHPYRVAWEARYGTEAQLLQQVDEMLQIIIGGKA